MDKQYTDISDCIDFPLLIIVLHPMILIHVLIIVEVKVYMFLQRSGRIEEQIEMLQVKLNHIEEGIGFGGKRTKVARSQGKKIQITIEQEYSRLLIFSYISLFYMLSFLF